jgi:integrase
MIKFADQLLTTPPRFPKSDIRYWQGRVFQRVRNRGGTRQAAKHFSVQLTAGGRREEFNLGSSNKSVAAHKAREIYEHLRVNGWDATLTMYKRAPVQGPATRGVRTVGDFIRAIEETSSRSRAMTEYVRRFRQIVAEIFRIETDFSKYDYRSHGREDRLKKIDAIALADVTTASIQAWRVARLNRTPKDPASQRAAKISINSTLRQARSLFSPRRLGYIQLPSGFKSPFDGVKLEPRQSMRYRSTFNVGELIRAAKKDLASIDPEAYKVFLLALFTGARRGEVDKLEWSAFDWAKQKLHIDVTTQLALKSTDSAGEIDLDPQVAEIFKAFYSVSTSSFVIESVRSSHVGTTYLSYRCGHIFKRLSGWLKTQGVRDAKPLHVLRKEYGSQICAAHGIYAASLALRHSDVAVTVAHYTDKRSRATTGLGGFLEEEQLS